MHQRPIPGAARQGKRVQPALLDLAARAASACSPRWRIRVGALALERGAPRSPARCRPRSRRRSAAAFAPLGVVGEDQHRGASRAGVGGPAIACRPSAPAGRAPAAVGPAVAMAVRRGTGGRREHATARPRPGDRWPACADAQQRPARLTRWWKKRKRGRKEGLAPWPRSRSRSSAGRRRSGRTSRPPGRHVQVARRDVASAMPAASSTPRRGLPVAPWPRGEGRQEREDAVRRQGLQDARRAEEGGQRRRERGRDHARVDRASGAARTRRMAP